MSQKTKHVLIAVAAVILVLKFRNQLAGLAARVPVVGKFVG